MIKRNPRHQIVAIGELVWDILPTGKVLGGFPVNLCYCLSCLGDKAVAVTAVGPDHLGERALSRFINERANRLGAWISSQAGATPPGTRAAARTITRQENLGTE